MRISIKIGFLEDLANSRPDIGLECQKLLRLLQKAHVSELQDQAQTFPGWRLYKLRYFPFILFSHPGNLIVLAKLEGDLVSIYRILILSDNRWQTLSAAEKAQRQAEEEAQRRIEEEQRRLEMERVRLDQEQRKVEEARQQVEEVRRQLEEKARQLDQERRKVEEARCEVEEARKQLEKERQDKTEKEAQQQKVEREDRKKRHIPLDHRPPRRSTTTEEPPEKPVLQEPGLRGPKPEIICLKRARQWILAVEIPVDLLENPGLTVLQNESPLLQDELDESYWYLKKSQEQVVIRWDEDGITRESNTILGEKDYLLFKLNNNQNEGRHIRSPSFGSYLAVVPDSWERDFELSGPPPIAPEPVSLEGYQAHFYILEKDDGRKIAFRSQEGRSVIIQPRASQFELVGNLLNDAHETMGPLFGEKPPRIRSLDDHLRWEDIGAVVVGEEGIGKLGWTKLFSPDPDKQEQDLPSEVTERGDGWYFIRIYDLKDELLESLDFRFIPTLQDIRILQPSPVPIKDGHKPIQVEFLHEPGCTIQSTGDLENMVQIEHGDNRTVLTLPANSNYDKTDWSISSRGTCQVQVTILVERLWWAIGEENQIPSEWKAQKLPLTREDFLATSRKTLWLRFPKPRWADKILVGFEQSKAHPVKVTESTVAIPLREFSDAQEIQNIGTILFNFWIHHRGTKYQIAACKLTLKANCRLCEFSISTEEDLWDHIKSDHLDAYFRLLTSEETRERIRDQVSALPREIYKCSHCNFYVESDDPRNPTTVMDRHSKEKSHEAGAPLGIKILSKVDEIREVLSKNLPHLYECKCGYLLRNAIPRDMIEHLRENHKNILYVFQ